MKTYDDIRQDENAAEGARLHDALEADEIVSLARLIKRLASADHFDIDDLKPIWVAAKRIEAAREQELNNADFFTEISNLPTAEAEDRMLVGGH